MPGLKWYSLKVVAADGLVGKRGVALRTPILQDEGRRIILPSRVEDETVEPRQVLPDAEYRELLDGHTWIPVRKLQAQRGHVLVVRSASFQEACQAVRLSEDLRWVDEHKDVTIAYVNRAFALEWRARCAKRFVQWAEKWLVEHFSFASHSTLADAHLVLEQALFVTDQGSPTRQRAFLLLGVLLGELTPAPSSWTLLAATALAESPQFDAARLDEEMKAVRRDLKARVGSPKQLPKWASDNGQCQQQPPSL